MELALSIASYLTPVSNALVYINVTKVHPVWFPFALAPTLHAARVSTIFQSNARRSPEPLSWGTYIVGYLIMCWGGGIISHLFLGIPPPMLYSFNPSIVYISVHLLVTFVFYISPGLLEPKVLDTVLWPLDALLRANAVTTTLGLFHYPNVYPEYQNSALTHMLIGAIVSAGGGLSAGTVGAWSNNWAFSTPPVLRAGVGWAGTLDIWGGALVALIYSSTTKHPSFTSLHRYTTLLLSSSYVSVARKPHADLDFPPLSTLEAKALATTVLAVLFAARVTKTHWLSPVPAKSVQTLKSKKKSQ